MSALEDAINSRRGGGKAGIPAELNPQTEPMPPRPATEIFEGRRVSGVRDSVPGEIGHDNLGGMKPEELVYNVENLKAFLTRTQKGCEFLLQNLSTPEGYEQIGLLVSLMGKAHDLLIAHDAMHRLGVEE